MRKTLLLLVTFFATAYIIFTANIYSTPLGIAVFAAFIISGLWLCQRFNKWMDGKQRKDQWVASRDIRTRRN